MRLKVLRKKQKLLQRELAAMLEMDTPLYSRIERGERKAKKETVVKLASLLNADKEELLTLWLADQLYSIAWEEEVALPALIMAEEEVKYQVFKRN